MSDLWPELPKPLWRKILRWAAFAFGLGLWGAGVAATYGDDYKLAVGLYFFGITLITADFLSWEDHRALRRWKKITLIVASAFAAIILFGLSVAWIQVRISDVRDDGREVEIPWPMRLWASLPPPPKHFIPIYPPNFKDFPSTVIPVPTHGHPSITMTLGNTKNSNYAFDTRFILTNHGPDTITNGFYRCEIKNVNPGGILKMDKPTLLDLEAIGAIGEDLPRDHSRSLFCDFTASNYLIEKVDPLIVQIWISYTYKKNPEQDGFRFWASRSKDGVYVWFEGGAPMTEH